jgi:hypothetical protein
MHRASVIEDLGLGFRGCYNASNIGGSTSKDRAKMKRSIFGNLYLWEMPWS